MGPETGCDPAAGPASAEWAEIRRQHAQGWRRLVFPGVFLVILLQTAQGVSRHSSGIAAAAGYIVLLAFCACYLAAIPTTWDGSRARFWALYGCLVGLFALELLFAHENAFVMTVFIAVLTVGGLGRLALPVVIGLTVTAVFLPAAIPSWNTGLGTDAAFSIPMVSLAMFGFFSLARSNRALGQARAEIARLAAENERSRIARDLHDLLGHSLTTITLKAGLAHRLAERDPRRAAAEIADVEELARRSLADVRAAVGGYREVTLAGELATGREVLRTAGIAAHLPPATDVVEPANQELFGWVVREGLTNTVRHARATHCTVTVGPNWIEIVDDGEPLRSGHADQPLRSGHADQPLRSGHADRGGAAEAGNGLFGLRERVEAVGGTVWAGPAVPSGWRLRVDVPGRAVDVAAPAATPGGVARR